ncbi:3-hydroxyacyl-CoA dehydrogenase [Curtobacterium sp. VKM Ac-2865]|uniref:3-hydroxyacyl-CoA dehydrogenase n=1 Tax=Curtobacterium sp. VKM Ac-2865 TaxID=2783817 RepID=UPI00188DBFA9|nr:3-hydroxyacyl-CoA dehydrogenase [Curtobacterium sp. VKM Ac-2865]MBF4582709.1 3-hydroxyacyl-CoA dehydrogenase [Curtobacterium sp. VKM Ac-2865]
MTTSPHGTTFIHVTVVGAGVLGAQIAFQVAVHGIPVVAYDVDDQAVEAARARLQTIRTQYLTDVGDDHRDAADAGLARITLTSDLATCAAEADLVIEAVPEVLALKERVYAELARTAPESTVFATNSSTLLPSQLADATGRPERFLALHFANHIWRQNTAEVMGSPRTDPEVFDRVLAFSTEIGMVPIPVRKEQPGYVLNSLLVPLLGAAAQLVLRGVAEPETVDATWRIGTGAPMGPFQIIDVVGLRTVHAISSASDDEGARLWAAYLQTNYLDQGKYGVESGEGFYRYS